MRLFLYKKIDTITTKSNITEKIRNKTRLYFYKSLLYIYSDNILLFNIFKSIHKYISLNYIEI